MKINKQQTGSGTKIALIVSGVVLLSPASCSHGSRRHAESPNDRCCEKTFSPSSSAWTSCRLPTRVPQAARPSSRR